MKAAIVAGRVTQDSFAFAEAEDDALEKNSLEIIWQREHLMSGFSDLKRPLSEMVWTF